MSYKRIYIDVFDNIPYDTALMYSVGMSKELKGQMGTVKWEGGICADCRKTDGDNLKVRVWKVKNEGTLR